MNLEAVEKVMSEHVCERLKRLKRVTLLEAEREEVTVKKDISVCVCREIVTLTEKRLRLLAYL